MSDMICRKTMMRCQTPGMCSPHGGCQDPVISELRAVNFDYRLGADAASVEIARLKAENEALRKDALRYQWIRDVGTSDREHWNSIAAQLPDEINDLIDSLMGKEDAQ